MTLVWEYKKFKPEEDGVGRNLKLAVKGKKMRRIPIKTWLQVIIIDLPSLNGIRKDAPSKNSIEKNHSRS